jgi:hypothetical protein
VRDLPAVAPGLHVPAAGEDDPVDALEQLLAVFLKFEVGKEHRQAAPGEHSSAAPEPVVVAVVGEPL